ncbi:hypothetical protein GCM10009837_62050 [Streptomyces durmitorensis]|uniref:DUF2267 domain-containing protein n=1 Tax=Streptomyces durmitorensis TaxID=319947 RepID=A0ABY4Q1N2_9ACTN|nr:DUF2267 domain-containing protein [Streptomyces durmitorensis]UQT60075.1 DUF2267 domain-containing protein [Streptomyces durmitorensis]
MNESVEVLLDRVQDRGGYAERQEAAGAVQSVLEVLGAHLVGDDRTDLARLLPRPCGPLLTESSPASEPLTPAAFIAAVGAHVDVDAGQARRAVTAVLATVAEVADDALLRRILTQLPPGHAGLFGRTDPT